MHCYVPAKSCASFLPAHIFVYQSGSSCNNTVTLAFCLGYCASKTAREKFFGEGDLTMYEDKNLVCKDCNQEFVFTAGEQEFYESRGFENEPQRCKPCRDARKNARRDAREMHTATCAACGAEARVPFEPREDRPVYCSECFARMKEEEAQHEA